VTGRSLLRVVVCHGLWNLLPASLSLVDTFQASVEGMHTVQSRLWRLVIAFAECKFRSHQFVR